MTKKTDTQLPVVKPDEQSQDTPPVDEAQTPPAQDEETVQPPIEPSPEQPSHHEQIAAFANGLDKLLEHANKQAQVPSEFQDRWAWWRNKLGEFLHEVKQHVEG